MRGQSEDQGRATLTYPEMFVPSDHPLRRIRPIVDQALANLSPRFDDLYTLIHRRRAHERLRMGAPL